MSQLENAFVESFEQDGTMDWIREQLGNEAKGSTEAPAEEAGTAEAETVVEDSTEEEAATNVADEEEAPAEDGLFLDLSPEDEKWLTKYGYDPENPESLTSDLLAKAIKGGRNAESLIGRRTADLSEERIAQLVEERVSGMFQDNIPYQWPDEDDEPEDQVRAFRGVAEEAFERQDGQAWNIAMSNWQQIDPLGSEAFATLKAAQITLLQAQGEPETQGDLRAGMAAMQEKYPALATPEFQQELGAEVGKYPSLGALLRGEIPGITMSERLAALDELAGRVASRQTAETTQQAIRRKVNLTSEEARKARAEARVAQQGGRGRLAREAEDEQIKLGKTGQAVGKNDLLEKIKAASGLDVEIG